MLFFKSKDFALVNSVIPNTVYRRKDDGCVAFICGVSRPKLEMYIDAIAFTGMTTTCVVHNDTTGLLKFESHRNKFRQTEYIHNKKDCKSVIVMFKSNSTIDNGVSFMQVSKFLELYELVVGYNTRGEMITNSMIDNITNTK